TPIFHGRGAVRVALPSYAFQRRRYWLDTLTASDPGSLGLSRLGADDGIDGEFWDAVAREDWEALGLEEGCTIGEISPLLSSWRQQRRAQSVIDQWRYRIGWKWLAEGPVRVSGKWLVMSPAGAAIGDEVCAVFTAAGLQTRCIEVDAERMTRQGIADLLESAGPWDEFCGVVSLIALGDGIGGDSTVVSRGVSGNVRLLQALREMGAEIPLWCVTSGAVIVGPSDRSVDATQSQMWGLGLVAGLELPQSWGGLIDLPSVWDDTILRSLPAVLSREDGEDQLAVRESGVYGRRMMRAPLPDSGRGKHWRPRGTVLVTGGTGGIGAHAARWLLTNGAEHVVLVSRRGRQAPDALELEQELGALGGRVTIMAADVAERDDVAAVLSTIDNDSVPLTAVIHAAGVVDQRPLTEVDSESLATTAAAKVGGAIHLDELLGDRRLDAFVLFSSGAATWGGAGLAEYAASNAHLDGLAEDRRSRGLAATSLAWGGWSGGGMTEIGTTTEYFDRLGIRLMEPDLALQALSQAVANNETLVTVADIDWQQFTVYYTLSRRRLLIAEIPDAQADTDSAIDSGDTGSRLRQRLSGLDEAEQIQILLELVRTQVAIVLG
ncbi:SDR family NAD(P)-dependent oxidoreductase, partial [Nocardia amikacinitolerans]|uniref:SDR family NAD(P)-dependent oxidoreductase n=1 Tax=Nocardia amikacinitolerans TaxID=756689 RepID=UPI00369CB76A